MRRRELLLVLTTPLIGARAVCAQQKAMPVIGWLSALSSAVQGGDRMPEAGKYGSLPVAGLSALAAFAKGLNEVGYVEGKNLAIEYRWAEGHPDWLPASAADLVARQVDVIVAVAGNAAARAAKGATSTIPIVFTTVQDAVETGLVASLARPEGNLTGFVYSPSDLDPKRLELISELVPKADTIGLFVHPPTVETYTRMMQEAAHAKGVQLLVLEASDDIEATFGSLIGLHAGALVVQSNPFFTQRGQQLVTLAAQYALPTTYHLRGFVAAGGLISYGPRVQELYRGAGTYVGRILAGAKAADLPVQQATTFELVVNLKAANALSLIVAPAILARADEVIE
jgi:putative ABC transport system substrate-binding protein